jgi:hypothetical protein
VNATNGTNGTGGSSPVARLLAGLAVAVAGVALVVVVATSLGDSENGSPDSGATGAEACNPKADAAVEAGFYIIKQDENLTLIAERTCIDEDDLASLNPDIDTFALQPDSCLNLEPKGCKNLEE